MSVRGCLEEQIGRLVHPSAHASAIEKARHHAFLTTRLALSFTVLAFVPFYLIGGGVPHWTDAIIFGWLLVPLIAAVHVSSTGRIDRGEAAGALGWIGLAATLTAGGSSALPSACAAMLLLACEATLSSDSRASGRALVIVLVGLAVLALTSLSGISFRVLAPTSHAVLMVAMAAYAAFVLCLAARVHRLAASLSAADLERWQILAQGMDDLTLRLNRTGLVLGMSGTVVPVSTMEPRDLLGRGLFERIHVADRPCFLKMVSDVAGRGAAGTCVIRLRTSSMASDDGAYQEPIFASVEVRTRRAANPAASGPDDLDLIAILRDVTADVARTAAVEQTARDAVRHSRSNDRFLATVSHELRTPLNAIIGFAEILASERHTPRAAEKQREYGGIIHASGVHLLSVVNSLLDMSKIDAGKFDLTLDSFDIGKLVDGCCDMVRLKAEQVRVDLVRSVAADLPELVGDQRACKQIVLNLLSNALKFTPEYGSVAIEARRDGEMLVLTVTDTGIGIPSQDMPRLGDPFFQAENNNDRRYEGTGLGLSVVTGLVGLHGGTITADSAPGEGTRIAVRLPLAGQAAQATSARAKIEILARHGRPAPPPDDSKKVQRIA